MSSGVPSNAANSGRVLNLSATITGMETNAGPPVREVTVNQVAAWNTARFRRAAGLTQEQLGARVGWSFHSVSEAERSWDGTRARKLDAQELTVLALALGVPVTALFLPPDDDGVTTRYVITGDCGTRYEMRDYLALAVLPDNDDGTPVMAAYRNRFNAAAGRYLDPEWAAAVAAWLPGSGSPARRADLAARLRDRERDALTAAAEWGQLADAIEGGTR
jgi:transcriptional regulator with XRE-family HTH domain